MSFNLGQWGILQLRGNHGGLIKVRQYLLPYLEVACRYLCAGKLVRILLLENYWSASVGFAWDGIYSIYQQGTRCLWLARVAQMDACVQFFCVLLKSCSDFDVWLRKVGGIAWSQFLTCMIVGHSGWVWSDPWKWGEWKWIKLDACTGFLTVMKKNQGCQRMEYRKVLCGAVKLTIRLNGTSRIAKEKLSWQIYIIHPFILSWRRKGKSWTSIFQAPDLTLIFNLCLFFSSSIFYFSYSTFKYFKKANKNDIACTALAQKHDMGMGHNLPVADPCPWQCQMFFQT